MHRGFVAPCTQRSLARTRQGMSSLFFCRMGEWPGLVSNLWAQTGSVTVKRHILALFKSFILGQGPRFWKTVAHFLLACNMEVKFILSTNIYLLSFCYMLVVRTTMVRERPRLPWWSLLPTFAKPGLGFLFLIKILKLIPRRMYLISCFCCCCC